MITVGLSSGTLATDSQQVVGVGARREPEKLPARRKPFGRRRCIATQWTRRSRSGQASDRFCEFGERSGDPLCRVDVDCEFVMVAAQVLEEGVPGDHDLHCAIGL
jgi:hypothetical protein